MEDITLEEFVELGDPFDADQGGTAREASVEEVIEWAESEAEVEEEELDQLI